MSQAKIKEEGWNCAFEKSINRSFVVVSIFKVYFLNLPIFLPPCYSSLLQRKLQLYAGEQTFLSTSSETACSCFPWQHCAFQSSASSSLNHYSPSLHILYRNNNNDNNNNYIFTEI